MTLILDGWSNIKNSSIFATTRSLRTGINSFLYDALDTGSIKKISNVLCKHVIMIINKCKKELKKDIFAIVTDNEYKKKKMKQLLQEKYPDLVVYGSSAHYLNLIEKDITPKTVLK